MNYNKKGQAGAGQMGISMALLAIFVIGIGIPVTQDVINDANLTGLTATVVGFAPVVIGAGFLFLAAKMSGLVK